MGDYQYWVLTKYCTDNCVYLYQLLPIQVYFDTPNINMILYKKDYKGKVVLLINDMMLTVFT